MSEVYNYGDRLEDFSEDLELFMKDYAKNPNSSLFIEDVNLLARLEDCMERTKEVSQEVVFKFKNNIFTSFYDNYRSCEDNIFNLNV